MKICCWLQAIEEVQKRFPSGIPLLHPEDDLSIKDPALRKAQSYALTLGQPLLMSFCIITRHCWLLCHCLFLIEQLMWVLKAVTLLSCVILIATVCNRSHSPVRMCRRLETFEGKLEKHRLAGAADLLERLRALQQKRMLKAQVRQAKREAKAAGNMILEDELKARRRILYRLRQEPIISLSRPLFRSV